MGALTPNHEEAAVRAGGMACLEQGLAAGRIVRSKHNGMPVFLFPRCEYSREKLFRQKLKGSKAKMIDDKGEFEKLAEDSLGLDLEVSQFINGSLGDNLTKSPAPLPSSASPMSLGGSSNVPVSDLWSSSQTMMAPFASAGGVNDQSLHRI